MENLKTNSLSASHFSQHSQILGALNEQSDTPDAPIQFLKATGRILSIWSFEQMCQAYVEQSPRTSTLPIRLVIELSKLPMKPWASLNSLCQLIGGHKPIPKPRTLFAPLIEEGLVEIDRSAFQCDSPQYFIRLTDKARYVSETHPDGRVMRKMSSDLSRYASAHPKASNSAGLVLTAIYVRKLGTPTDIAEQIYGSREIPPSTKVRKVAKAFSHLSIVDYQSLGMGRGAKAQILEVIE